MDTQNHSDNIIDPFFFAIDISEELIKRNVHVYRICHKPDTQWTILLLRRFPLFNGMLQVDYISATKTLQISWKPIFCFTKSHVLEKITEQIPVDKLKYIEKICNRIIYYYLSK